MDLSEDYQLRCEKAVEIQKIWKRVQGDFFVIFDEISLYHRPSHYAKNYSFIITKNGNSRTLTQKEWESENCIWLPRQDQLQNMMLVNYDESPYHLLEDFHKYIEWNSKLMGGFFIDHNTIEKMWLSFAMDRLSNKEWNDTSKKWVKLFKR